MILASKTHIQTAERQVFSKTMERNERVVRAYVEAFKRGNVEDVCECFTPDAIVYGILGPGSLTEVRPLWESLMQSFTPKIHIESIVSEGDTLAVRYIERGTFSASFRGHKPTNRSYKIAAMEWFVFRDGRISRRWGVRDAAAISRQVGLPAKSDRPGLSLFDFCSPRAWRADRRDLANNAA